MKAAERMACRSAFLAAVCGLAAAACQPPPSFTGGLGDDCARAADCATPFVCLDGKCGMDAHQICEKEVTRCNGDVIETCSPLQEQWIIKETCATGCVNGTCKPQACPPNKRKCDNTNLLQCNTNGTGWALMQACAAGCVEVKTGAETVAKCADPVCTPFDAKCDNSGTTSVPTVLTCNSRGTGWVAEACPQDETNSIETVCVTGRCMPRVCQNEYHPDTGALVKQTQRCLGPVRQQCNLTETGWESLQVCSWGCAVTGGTAACKENVCTPFATDCGTDPTKLKTCRADGTGWDESACGAPADPAVCVKVTAFDARCLPVVCTTTGANRQQRCVGAVRQQCNDSGTGWDPLVAATTPPGLNDATNAALCKYGCLEAGGAATCQPAVCRAPTTSFVGETVCSGQNLMRCLPDASGFAFAQFCPAGCEAAADAAPNRNAACKVPVCAPLSRRCDTTTTKVEVCRQDGTAWDLVENCPQNCVGGICVARDTSCVPGEVRCQGAEAQKCVRKADNSTEWQFVERCLGVCSAGTCLAGGACGCLADATPNAPACSPLATSTRQPIKVRTFLPASGSGSKVTCDGQSTVLFFTDPITDVDGNPVPDGTLVTWSHDGDTGYVLMASADASAEIPGLQRPTLRGRARLLLRFGRLSPTNAPEGCPQTDATIRVTAQIAGSCAGSTTLTSTPLVTTGTPPPPHYALVSEDFSTTTREDRINTTAVWETGRGAAYTMPAFRLGTGADGLLTVPVVAGAVPATDLWANGLGRGYLVTTLGPSDAWVQEAQPGLSPGDEVLVIVSYAHGPWAGTTGLYEFHRVARVENSHVFFAEPFVIGLPDINLTDAAEVARRWPDPTYGSNRVYVQRVPQFTDVVFAGAGARLTTTKFQLDSGLPGGSGVLAFRATGTVGVSAGDAVNVNDCGLGAAVTMPVAGDARIGRMLLGGASTANKQGGGIIYINAGRITMPDTAAMVATSTATNKAGTGGTIWIGAGSLEHLGSTVKYKTGTAASDGGRIRLDYGQITTAVMTGATPPDPADPTTTASPAANLYIGQRGIFTDLEGTGPSIHQVDGYLAQSNVVLKVGSGLFQNAKVLGVIGGTGETLVRTYQEGPPVVSPSLPGVFLTLSADAGTTYGAPAANGTVVFTPYATPPPAKPWAGTQLLVRARFAALTDRPVELLGYTILVSRY